MRIVSAVNVKDATHISKIKELNENDILHIYDVFHKIDLKELFEEKGTPGIILSDHITYFKNFFKNIEFIGLPLWLEQQRKKWKLEEFADQPLQTDYCFNFMVNKKQVNRYLCIKLVELFDYKNFTYTWSGAGTNFDCTDIIKEKEFLGKNSPLTTEQFGNILAQINLKPVFYKSAEAKISEQDGSSVSFYGGNRNSWDWGCDKIFLHSAVSLITESLTFQEATTFTEKTLYSVLGLNFPIWVGGGIEQASNWKKLGFDIFEDVINHDYQYYDTLLERCVYAFKLNNKILTDLDYAKKIRIQNKKRLQQNRDLILSGQLENFIKKDIETYPDEIKEKILVVVKEFLKT